MPTDKSDLTMRRLLVGNSDRTPNSIASPVDVMSHERRIVSPRILGLSTRLAGRGPDDA
ncbi:hypothetical protein ACIO53_05150 [Streptomyces sp. NPDC087305]|uniref:hypothetical protein n=1 Tax=Streptomyces sp. NPDC087305 TaxID=3365781 RepID=UPI003809DC1E